MMQQKQSTLWDKEEISIKDAKWKFSLKNVLSINIHIAFFKLLQKDSQFNYIHI